MITYVTGDVLNDAPCFKRKFITHVVNDIGQMGSGVAKAIKDKYPLVKEEYEKWKLYEEYKLKDKIIPFKLGEIQIVPVEKFVYVINMIAQHETIRTNPKPIRYAALTDCMEKVYNVVKKNDGEIHAPKFGSGLAAGNWDFIEELINEIWFDIPVYIYCLKES